MTPYFVAFVVIYPRGARRSINGGVLWSYVDAKPDERNEADGRFSAAC